MSDIATPRAISMVMPGVVDVLRLDRYGTVQ